VTRAIYQGNRRFIRTRARIGGAGRDPGRGGERGGIKD